MRKLLALLSVGLVAALAGAQPILADGTPVLTLPGSPVVVDVENTTSGVATFDVSALDEIGNALGVTCDHASGDSFPLGTTTVNCSATDPVSLITTSGSFEVLVQDTTSPALDLPAPITVDVNGTASATVTFSATALDAGTSYPVTCSPESGSSFSLGTTHVSCSATDVAGNTGSGGFDVSVRDTTPPTITVPSPITVGVNGASSTVVTYAVSAADGSTPLTPSCAPASGTSFPLGTTTVNCTAADAAGNQAGGSFTVTVQDTTAPAVSITGGPTGTVNARNASISFTASEGVTSCRLDGGAYAPCSSPASYAGLGDGNHTFDVRAVDAADNVGSASLSWSIDATPPTISGPASAIVVEADGPAGGTATFTVTASDRGAPLVPSAVSCSPRSGSTFPLGDTSVACKATDSLGNVARAAFHVIVRDTTPPAINAPNVTVTATSAAGIHKTDAALGGYLAHITATDLVSTPTLTNDVPDLLSVGTTTVTFTATDAAGNVAAKRSVVTVLPVGKKAPPPDLTPPANPTVVVAKAGDHRVGLSWKTSKDTAYVTVTLSVVGENKPGKEVYRGSAGKHTITRLKNGTTYRFVLVAWDKAGNRSRGAVVRAVLKAELLGSPVDNARVTRPPLLRWTPVPGATYFNVQLWRGKRKVLSTWPSVAHLQLTAAWTYEGKKQTLEPGVYIWYVWPGLGDRTAARYGALLGSHTFVVVKKPPPV